MRREARSRHSGRVAIRNKATELSQLQYFRTAVEEGSISAASKKLYISHQALSKAISRLEAELGTDLLVRYAGGVLPTECGYEVLRASQDIDAQIELMNKRIASITHGSIRTVHAVVSDYLGIGEGALNQAIGLCRERDLRLTCGNADDDRCFDLIASRDADVAFVLSADPPRRDGISAREVCAFPLYLSIDKNLPCAGTAHLTEDDCKSLHLPCRDATTESIIRSAFAHEGVLGCIILEHYDSSRIFFPAHLHDCCNASLVSAQYIADAQSGAHTVRRFPSDGWAPLAYAIWETGRSHEPALAVARDTLAVLVAKMSHQIDPSRLDIQTDAPEER